MNPYLIKAKNIAITAALMIVIGIALSMEFVGKAGHFVFKLISELFDLLRHYGNKLFWWGYTK